MGIEVKNTKVCVIGLGYIGLPTAAILATKGFEVLGVDVSEAVIRTISRGGIHIVEPDLDILVKSAVESNRLTASLVPEAADIFILCVPTPFKQNHHPDLSYVDAATDSILPLLKKNDLIILESTSPVGTTQHIAQRIEEKTGFKAGQDCFVAHCPERVLPGRILQEAIENARIIGGVTPKCTEKTLEFYRTFVHGKCHPTHASVAEMTKLVENSFRDVNIAFANELSMICHELKLDAWEVIRLANHHPRVKILNPGPGVGGHCIAVDPWFIIASAPEQTRLIRTARQVNDEKPHFVMERAEELIKIHGKPLGIFGLTFKANVDDFRESPALEIAKQLTQKYGKDVIACHDPYTEGLAGVNGLKGLQLKPLEQLLEESRCFLLLVDHDEYRALHLTHCYDTRGIFQNRTCAEF